MQELKPLIDACREAADGPAPYDAISTLLTDFAADHQTWAGKISPASTEVHTPDGDLLGADETLFEDDKMTVVLVDTEPGFDQPPHDHRMEAIIGVFEGAEVHRFFERTEDGPPLNPAGDRTVAAGSIIGLRTEAVHAIASTPSGACRAVHVYLGRLSTVDRSVFHPETFEESPLTLDAYNEMCRPWPAGG